MTTHPILGPIDLSQFDASTRMRWYAVMNSWGTPDDLPFDVEPGCDKEDIDYRTKCPNWVAASRAIRVTLTDQQLSWGWWREQRLGDFEQWSAWWGSNRPWPVNIREDGEFIEGEKS